MKKRILISVSYYVPHLSGLTNAVRNLAELLADNEYSVTVLTTQHDKTLPLQETMNGVAIRRVPYFAKISKGFFMPTFLLAAYQAVTAADQVVIHLPQVEGWIIAGLAKFLGKRVHCYYVCEVTLGNTFSAKLMENVLRFANRISLFLADTIITSSADFATHTPVLKQFASKVRVIPFIITTPTILASAEKELTKQIGKKEFTIGFIGRISAEKGIEYLLNAIPDLQKQLATNFSIVLAGPAQVIGENAYREKIALLLQKYREHIVQLGQLQQTELGALYKLLNVLVLPSVNNTEAFGMVQVEAMLCGTPVVASNLPGVRVPVRLTGMGELSEPQNSEMLVEKIVAVLQHKKTYIKSKKVIEDYFSTNKILQDYTDLLG